MTAPRRRRRSRDGANAGTEASRRHAKRLRRRPLSAILRDVKAPEISYVAVLRFAHPEAPSLRDVGRRIGLSAAALSAFELGRAMIGQEKLEAYAQAVGRPVQEVRWRWTRQAIAFHSEQMQQLRSELERMDAPESRKSAAPLLSKSRRKRPVDSVKSRP